jgi:hypothetical protein
MTYPPSYQQRIEALTATKRDFNTRKLTKEGFHDVDDHGYIPWDEPVAYVKKPSHPDGGCYGMTSLAANFRAWLDAHPAYVHSLSAVACAWIGTFPGLQGWRPEHRPVHLEAIQKKYNTPSAGIGAMNHLAPDMRIGLELGWGGLLGKIRKHRAEAVGSGAKDTSFWDGEEQVVLAIRDWVGRHAVTAQIGRAHV